MNYIIQAILITLIFTACASTPLKNSEEVRRNKNKAYSSAVAALSFDNEVIISNDKKRVVFSKESPLVQTPTGTTTFQKISLKKDGTIPRYLVLASANHLIGKMTDTKIGYIVPSVEWFDSNKKSLSAPLVQFGENSICGLGRCLISVFDLSNLSASQISGLILAKVDDAEKPFEVKKESLTQLVENTVINQSFDISFYADYYGDVDIYFSEQLPLKNQGAGQTIFYQKR